MSDYEHLEFTAENKDLIKNLSTMGTHLKELKIKLIQAEDVYNAAKKEYEYYANSILPVEMFNAGITKLELADGGLLSYERKYYCTPNKNEADKKIMADWLREHGGEHLIKERAAVDAAKIPELKKTGIPFTEICDFNTQSLKAFLTDLIGARKGSTAQIAIDDIPNVMHFQEQGLVTIEV